MYHRNYTTYLHKELDFLKLLVSRFHELEQVNDLELVVALQKTQEIYERFLKIKLLTNSAIYEKPIEAPTTIVEEKITDPVLPIDPPVDVSPVISPVIQHPIPVVSQPIEQNVEVAIAHTNSPIIEEKKKASILAEKISPTDFQPINETLAQQKTGNDLSSKLQTAPLSSIASGIGINDKFLYIRELFMGDSNLYNNVVKYLDTVDSFDEALTFIQKNFDWDEKNETVQKFIGLVQRRHVT